MAAIQNTESDKIPYLAAVATAPDGMVTLTVFEDDIAASVELTQEAAHQIAELLIRSPQ